MVYLADYGQSTLVPLAGVDVPPRQELALKGTVAGVAFRRVTLMRTSLEEGGHRLWVPLLDGVERLGVLELLVDDTSPLVEDEARVFSALVSELIVANDAYTDVFSRLRRRRTMSLAAEIQWELLPPLAFATDRLVISGALEPAYDIGGDTFDYAATRDMADLLVLDAVGHGLPAALHAAAAVGAYRHARREGLDLPEIAEQINSLIADQFDAEK